MQIITTDVFVCKDVNISDLKSSTEHQIGNEVLSRTSTVHISSKKIH